MTIQSIKYRIQDLLFRKFAIPVSINEKISKKYIKKFLPDQPTIIDCGAHDGSDSIELASIIGGRIYSFEPVPAVFKKLQDKTMKFNSIKCFQQALADRDGHIDFHVSGGTSDGSSSILVPKEHLNDHPDVSFNEVIRVKCQTLDAWAEENKIEKIDLLWLDMQGFEMQMLMTSPRMLNKVIAIHTEVSTRETYHGVVTYNKMKSWLEEQGFKVQFEAIPDCYDMGNVFFIRK